MCLFLGNIYFACCNLQHIVAGVKKNLFMLIKVSNRQAFPVSFKFVFAIFSASAILSSDLCCVKSQDGDSVEIIFRCYVIDVLKSTF